MERITGQVIYVGPTIPQLGIHYGNIFSDGIFEHFYNYIAACPSLGALFVPVAQHAAVRRELNFDYARNMRGKKGRYVQLYNEVQRWLSERAKASDSQTPTTKGVKLKQHA
jgi:hypothetical protein